MFWRFRKRELSKREKFDKFLPLRSHKKEVKRKEIPLLSASTLLIPGYVDEKEVKAIARFIASVGRDIPYSLLAYAPHFEMEDIGYTAREFAEACAGIAKEEGLQNVRIGNIHLLK